jgi:hypothetical protein
MQGGSLALEDTTMRITPAATTQSAVAAAQAPPHAGCGEIVRSRAYLRQVCRVEHLGTVACATGAAKLFLRSSRFHLQRDSRRLIQCFLKYSIN